MIEDIIKTFLSMVENSVTRWKYLWLHSSIFIKRALVNEFHLKHVLSSICHCLLIFVSFVKKFSERRGLLYTKYEKEAVG